MRRPSWYPERLLVANVAGRALISDYYIVGEWRNDPRPGFSVPEGAWWRAWRHDYEPADEDPRKIARKLRSITPGGRAINRYDPTLVRVAEQRPSDYTDPYRDIPLVPFVADEVKAYVNPRLLAALVYMIDGEPERWEITTPERPIDAWDGRHWLGAIMPVRVPR